MLQSDREKERVPEERRGREGVMEGGVARRKGWREGGRGGRREGVREGGGKEGREGVREGNFFIL